MRSAVKIRGALKDKMSELLGGKNVTEARVNALLEELAEKRKEPDVVAAESEQRNKVENLKIETLHRQVHPSTLETQEDPRDLEDEGEDQDAEVEDEETQARLAAPAEATVEDPEKALLRKMLSDQEAKIKELMKPKAGEVDKELDQAIGDGRVPLPAPRPTGYLYARPDDIPRGKPFPSPWNPRVQLFLCDCGECKPHREVHYFCAICHGGPFAYLGPTAPRFRKVWAAPGGAWGVKHECCSEVCGQRLMGELGMRRGWDSPAAGPNQTRGDMEYPAALEAQKPPQRMMGSD